MSYNQFQIEVHQRKSARDTQPMLQVKCKHCSHEANNYHLEEQPSESTTHS